MAKYGFKDMMKISSKEREYVSTLSAEEKAAFKKLTRGERDDAIWNYLNAGEEVAPKSQEKTETWLQKKGISDPSAVTLNAIYPLSSDSKLSTFTNNIGTFTLDAHKQAEMFNNLILQKQNYTLIAQQDEIIKQNDKIIDLLSQIAEK